MSAPVVPSAHVTLRSGEPVAVRADAASAVATLDATDMPGPIDLDAFDESTTSNPPSDPRLTTVLPRRRPDGNTMLEPRARFEALRVLGGGGMGRVELARDNDIRRTVAVKRLHARSQSNEAMLRFADEVRIVGQLEHPAIVPVYDVGRDEAGEVYLVMKHLHGETMEQIIAKLRAGEPGYAARFSIPYRIHLFLGILDAIRYAHARGVLHRDIKPSNVVIGPYGEATVVDWGVAKPIRRPEQEAPAVLERPVALDTAGNAPNVTQLGSLVGTPLYMSPEQAAGHNDALDERSDVYSLCVLLYEWLSLHHPLEDKRTVTEVLAAIISGEPSPTVLARRAVLLGVPAEWANVLKRGLVCDREQRLASVAELESAVREVLDGFPRIECTLSFAKRAVQTLVHQVDRHPAVSFFVVWSAVLSLGVALITSIVWLMLGT